MTDPHQPDQSADGERPGQEPTRQEPNQGEATQPAPEPPQADAEHPGADAGHAGTEAEHADTEVEHTGTEDTQAQGASTAQPNATRKSLLIGLGGGALVVVVVLAIAAFVWPACLIGPGKPDGKAAEAVAALASKNPGDLEKVACHGPDGKAVAQLPPQALQLIQTAKQAGPPHLLLDTQARAPVDLTLSALGQTRDIPIDVVLGVTKGEWCMNGIAERQ